MSEDWISGLDGLTIARPPVGLEAVLQRDALMLVRDMHRAFRQRLSSLLRQRQERRLAIARTGALSFGDATRGIRNDASWRVIPPPADLEDRRVEITGPTDAKMIINAWNSGARVHLADFEDANAPTWDNLVRGQANLRAANEGSLSFDGSNGQHYELGPTPAIPIVRPRGWHLPEKHVLVSEEPVIAALFDFGVYLALNATALIAKGSGPYFYLPKLESHHEARLWNDVFIFAQEWLGIPVGTIKATVLIETVTAAFEMDEILFELREHASGLNAGRWDYLFSIIKNFRDCGKEFILPDRSSLTMTVPFMRSYTELLVATCHRRGAMAIGGMSAFIPNRRDATVTVHAIENVRADKEREAADGFDGTWVAHPDLVPVAMEAFDRHLGTKPNQLGWRNNDVGVSGADLLKVNSVPGTITETGLRNNVAVATRYLAAWLAGSGAVAIFNLMEDVATAEISRSQIWQWISQSVVLDNGSEVNVELVRRILSEEVDLIRKEMPPTIDTSRLDDAVALFEQIAMGEEFVEFLTEPAYALLA